MVVLEVSIGLYPGLVVFVRPLLLLLLDTVLSLTLLEGGVSELERIVSVFFLLLNGDFRKLFLCSPEVDLELPFLSSADSRAEESESLVVFRFLFACWGETLLLFLLINFTGELLNFLVMLSVLGALLAFVIRLIGELLKTSSSVDVVWSELSLLLCRGDRDECLGEDSEELEPRLILPSSSFVFPGWGSCKVLTYYTMFFRMLCY